MQKELIFSGFGGQGVMFVGQLLAYTAMDEGYEATWIPSYGPEMRGGTAHCYVVISDQAIGSPIVKHPRVAVIFNIPSFERYERAVRAEFAEVDSQTYAAGRSAVLRAFLERPSIYLTQRGRRLWESDARRNLERSLANIRSSHGGL